MPPDATDHKTDYGGWGERTKAQIYHWCKSPSHDERQRAVEKVLGSLDYLLRREQYAAVDHMVLDLDIERLTPEVVVAILTITHFAKEHLPHRHLFVDAADRELVAALGQARAERILQGRR